MTASPGNRDAPTVSGAANESHGRVVANHGKHLRVRDGATLHTCTARRGLPAVVSGDRVVWRSISDGDSDGVVTALLPRRSLLARTDLRGRQRPVAANVDQILVVVAPLPTLQSALIDRFLVVAELQAIAPALILNKIDLLDETARREARETLQLYRQLGYPVTECSAASGDGIEALEALMRDRISVLVGQSGVGKSSLTAKLVPDSRAAVGELSRATGFGRHTTSAATLYELPGGGDIIDSPGVRSFGLWHITDDDLPRGFVEFLPHLGECHYRDCRHRSEPGCEILSAVRRGDIQERRLQSYHQLLESAAENR